MNVTRITGLLALAASLALSACGGRGRAHDGHRGGGSDQHGGRLYRPAPATADVQAFAVNFWANVRVQNRCGQCHNATSPAQMPNFARSDDVNLAYAQANTVVNLAQPASSLIVTKVSGRTQLLAGGSPGLRHDFDDVDQQLGRRPPEPLPATQVQLVAPPIQTVGQSLNFPNDGGIDYSQTVYTLTSKYCVRCHSTTASAATEQSPYFADPTLAVAYPQRYRKSTFTGCTPSNAPNFATTCGVNSRFYQRLLTDNHNCWDNCAADAAQMWWRFRRSPKCCLPAASILPWSSARL